MIDEIEKYNNTYYAKEKADVIQGRKKIREIDYYYLVNGSRSRKGREKTGMIQNQITSVTIWMLTINILMLLAAALLFMLHYLQNHTVRVYNWDGRRYRYIGRSRLRKEQDSYIVKLREHLADISYTTRYRFCFGRSFTKKYRYQDLLVRAGRNAAWVPVEEKAQCMVYYRRGF